ncbi:MAG: FkbM family methyltransferase [Pseudomonadota bacterium]
MSFLNRVEAKHGSFFTLPGDTYIGRSLALYGQWCESEVRLFQQILRPGHAVVEVGANIGSHTVPIARTVGPHGPVFAVEMQPFLSQILAANLLINGITNAQVVQAGVAQEASSLLVPGIRYDADFNFGGISVDFLREKGRGTGQRVPIMPLDDLLTLPRLNFLKLDVEHLEQEALEGGRETIRRHRPVIYLENDHAEAAEGIFEVLLSEGYRCFWHRSFLWDPGNHSGHGENVFGEFRCINLLALPDDRTVNGLTPAPDASSHPKLVQSV